MTVPDLSGATWRKSSRSGSNADCVEIAELRQTVAVRDSKDPHGPALAFTHSAWTSFVNGLAAVPCGLKRSNNPATAHAPLGRTPDTVPRGRSPWLEEGLVPVVCDESAQTLLKAGPDPLDAGISSDKYYTVFCQEKPFLGLKDHPDREYHHS
jgi:hypothetical protein